MSRHRWFSHYPEQYRSSEIIGLRPNDKYNVFEKKRIQILQEYKYYVECMRAIIWTNDGRIVVKRPKMLSLRRV